jgi:hypothetical protein
MKKQVVLGVFVALAVLIVAGTPAFAQATRTWVSGVGDDANPCSRTAPCKTFAGAISKTAVGGEINVLDPGGFGAVTITKAITISSQSSEAGVLVSGTNGIVVAVANATDTVILRGLDIEGLGTGLSGILVNTGGNVWVENCTINNFTDSGIKFTPTVSGSSLHVSNTYVRNNGNFGASTGQGILVGPSGTATGDLELVRLTHNVAGLKITGASTVTVTSSLATNNVFAGFTGAGTALNLEKSVSAHNGTGVNCSSGITRIGNMSITDNTADISTPTVNCTTFKNNDISSIAGGMTQANPQ